MAASEAALNSESLAAGACNSSWTFRELDVHGASEFKSSLRTVFDGLGIGSSSSDQVGLRWCRCPCNSRSHKDYTDADTDAELIAVHTTMTGGQKGQSMRGMLMRRTK